MATNKHTMALRGGQLIFNECDMFGNQYKKLQTGQGFFIAIEGGKSFDVECSNLIIKPIEGQHYIYAKWPTSGVKGELIHTKEPMSDDSENYYILITSGTYEQLNLN